MEKLISCCGLDCTTCDARNATISNDMDLRAKTAENWSVQFNAVLTAEMINCVGCRETGVHFAHCTQCEIRNCMKDKGFETCGDCSELDSCPKIANILHFVPDAKTNLLSLQ